MVMRIPISQGLFTLVDDADYATVMDAGPWYAARTTPTVVYVLRNIPASHTIHGRTSQALHKFLTGWRLADHINCDGLDNRRVNLRQATQSQQMANQRRRSDNTTGYRGVVYRRGYVKPWAASIVRQGARTFLGYFPTAIDAAIAYDSAAIDLFGEFARLNFPLEQTG